MHNNQHKHHLLLISVLEFQLQISFFSRIQISFIKKKKKKKRSDHYSLMKRSKKAREHWLHHVFELFSLKDENDEEPNIFY